MQLLADHQLPSKRRQDYQPDDPQDAEEPPDLEPAASDDDLGDKRDMIVTPGHREPPGRGFVQPGA